MVPPCTFNTKVTARPPRRQPSVTLRRRLIPDFLELTARVPLRPTGGRQFPTQVEQQGHVQRFAMEIHARRPLVTGLVIAVGEVVFAMGSPGGHAAIDQVISR